MKMIDINKELGITSIDFNNIDINNNTETVNESIVDLYFFLFLFKFL